MDFDVSILLNVHNESGYLLRTLRSTEEAARYVRSQGVRIELLIVLDRPTLELAAQVARYDPAAFDGFQTVTVDNGSLGPSRNDGIAIARGEYVTACDADDLISFNAFASLLETARREGPRAIAFAEYLFMFGSEYWVGHYSGSDIVTPLRVVTHNPFPARFFAPRELLLKIPLADIRLGPGFAFEDWHLNCQLLAAGVRFVIAPDTILFYRRRSTSLSAEFDRVSVRQIPPSRLFEPTCFLSTAGPAYALYTQARGEEAGMEAADAEAVRASADFLQTAVCRELVHAANLIDPAIDLNRYGNGNWWGTRTFPIHAGIAYYRLCQTLGSNGPFSDIVFAPSKDSLDAARYIAEVLCGLAWSGQAASVLVLAEQEAELEPLRGLLPPGTISVSMYPLHPQLTEEDVDVLTIKVLQATAAKARIHFGRSVYAARFWRRFGPLLRDNRAILYRLGEDRRTVDGREFLVDEDFNFISDCLGTLDMLLSGNQGIIARDQTRIGTMLDKWRLLPVPVTAAPVVRDHDGFHYRLVWLAQPEEVDQIDLPIAVAAVLASYGLNVRIDSWSGAIGPSQIDAVLCTARPSGLRRPLLEAMAAGLPIIARQTGGLDDLVLDGRTGLTLKEPLDEAALADACAMAIKHLYDDAIRYAMLSRQARELVETRHGRDAFLAKVKEIFADADAA